MLVLACPDAGMLYAAVAVVGVVGLMVVTGLVLKVVAIVKMLGG
jgi:hypothetical protein